MHAVYSNTCLNISATGVQDSSVGLFAHRDGELEVLPTIISSPSEAGWLYESKELVVEEDKLIEFEITNAGLNRRGWAKFLAHEPTLRHYDDYEQMSKTYMG